MVRGMDRSKRGNLHGCDKKGDEFMPENVLPESELLRGYYRQIDTGTPQPPLLGFSKNRQFVCPPVALRWALFPLILP